MAVGTGLADFREKYPQYSNIDDEELGSLVKQKFYPDMDDAAYRESMGLPMPESQSVSEPTMWDRVTSVFDRELDTPQAIMKPNHGNDVDFSKEITAPKAEQSSQQSPLLRDQFFAGFDEWRSNLATKSALDAIGTYNQASDIALGQNQGEPTGQYGLQLPRAPGSCALRVPSRATPRRKPRSMRMLPI